VGAAPGGGAEVPLPVSGLSLMQWMGMKLDTFDGSGTPVEAVDWLTYVEDKMNVFEIVYGDRVCFGTQLLKGELKFGGEACRQLTTPHQESCPRMFSSGSLRGGSTRSPSWRK
jgi:hypothetical protein